MIFSRTVVGIRSLIFGLLLGALLFLGGCAVSESSASDSSQPVSASARQFDGAALSDRSAPTPEQEEAVERTALLSFTGDLMLGDQWQAGSYFQTTFETEGPEYFLGAMQDVFAYDDLTIGNLECPLTESTENFAKGENVEGEPTLYYWFKGPPENAQILTAGSVELVQFYSNHDNDFGYQGMVDTWAALDAVGVGYYGGEDLIIRDVNGIRIGFLGLKFNSNYDTIAAGVNSLREEGCEIVIATFQEGDVFPTDTPSDAQIAAAHNAIDSGADAVMQHHNHTLQGTEIYNGHFIAYALGDFCYGGSRYPKDYDAIAVQLQITINDMTGKITIEPTILPVSKSSSVDVNDFRPYLLEGSEADRVHSRIAELSEGL